MKRSAPLGRSSPLKNSRKRVRAVNGRRRRRLFNRNFGPKADWIRSLGCLRGCSTTAPSQAAHVRARGMGGCKGSAADLVPLCYRCHDLLDSRCGSPARFLALTGMDLVTEAERLELAWSNREKQR